MGLLLFGHGVAVVVVGVIEVGKCMWFNVVRCVDQYICGGNLGGAVLLGDTGGMHTCCCGGPMQKVCPCISTHTAGPHTTSHTRA